MSKKVRRVLKKKPNKEDAMLTAVGAYLKTKGWHVVVIGGRQTIEQDGGTYNFRFTVGFTGCRPGADAESSTKLKEQAPHGNSEGEKK